MQLIERRYNPETGITDETWLHPDRKRVTMRRLQDVEPILKANQASYNSYGKRSKMPDGLGRKVASIPHVLVEKWMNEGFNVLTCSEAELHAKLNDPEYRKLRTAPGRL